MNDKTDQCLRCINWKNKINGKDCFILNTNKHQTCANFKSDDLKDKSFVNENIKIIREDRQSKRKYVR